MTVADNVDLRLLMCFWKTDSATCKAEKEDRDAKTVADWYVANPSLKNDAELGQQLDAAAGRDEAAWCRVQENGRCFRVQGRK